MQIVTTVLLIVRIGNAVGDLRSRMARPCNHWFGKGLRSDYAACRKLVLSLWCGSRGLVACGVDNFPASGLHVLLYACAEAAGLVTYSRGASVKIVFFARSSRWPSS